MMLSQTWSKAATRVQSVLGAAMPISAAPQRRSLSTAAKDRLLAFFSDQHVVPLDEKHRFPMDKYARTRAALEHDASLADKLELLPAPAASVEELTAVHTPEYVQRFVEGSMSTADMRSIGFPWSKELVTRSLTSAGGTLAAVRAVLQEGLHMAANVAGGTHHAFADRGEGFCVFNDLAVAATAAIREHGLERILVVDLDVHQGNGTSAIFAEEPRVTTFDVHGHGNYPWRTRSKSTHDVPLPDGAGDDVVLPLLQRWLPKLLREVRPQLILYQAGVDALAGDAFGRLGMTRGGLNVRNNMVYSFALQNCIPLVITMGGGYTRPMDQTVDCHTDVYRTAAYRHHAWVTAQQQQQQQQATHQEAVVQ